MYYEYREELNDMCNLSEGIEEKGMKKGMKKGIETGRLETIGGMPAKWNDEWCKSVAESDRRRDWKATELFLKKGE